MPSPKPKPTALKIISGNPGRRPLNMGEGFPKSDCGTHVQVQHKEQTLRLIDRGSGFSRLRWLTRQAEAAEWTRKEGQ